MYVAASLGPLHPVSKRIKNGPLLIPWKRYLLLMSHVFLNLYSECLYQVNRNIELHGRELVSGELVSGEFCLIPLDLVIQIY